MEESSLEKWFWRPVIHLREAILEGGGVALIVWGVLEWRIRYPQV